MLLIRISPQTESRRINPESMAKGTPIDIAAQGMIQQKELSVSGRYWTKLGGSPGQTDTECVDVPFDHSSRYLKATLVRRKEYGRG
jgi:hypothetical protein